MLKSFNKRSFVRYCSAVLFVLALSISLRAQSIRPLSIDVAGNVGVGSLAGIYVNGQTLPLNNTLHAEYGASAGVNLTKHIAVVGEYNYLPQGSQIPPGSSTTVNGSYWMAGGAVRIAPFQYKRYVPYLVGGGGYIHGNITAASGGVTSTIYSQGGDYVSYGAGVSIYIWHNLGIRPEFRQDRQVYASVNGTTQTARQNANRGTVSIFYQFGGKKPKS
jgi:Outer membrane protein beta-barrel domain